ncbi:reverse transcriptase [Senna tora]|uniref:Reverse transcriptase n=1 Tax=Senna tora TaxID=362788 RepID=A0A834TZJ4_9FABA|nr:reverse transcriptase [Senna tora]
MRSSSCEEALIKWHPPEDSWLKLNVDCSFWSHTGEISCGRALRDSDGRWVAGFSKKMGKRCWEVTCRHTLREGNRLTNVLTNLAHRMPYGLCNWSEPPQECNSILYDDLRGLWLPRGFSG